MIDVKKWVWDAFKEQIEGNKMVPPRHLLEDPGCFGKVIAYIERYIKEHPPCTIGETTGSIGTT